ncbi:MAG: hypothetical protein MZV64_02795 [Ignavibacteriales bacterium]|nr:hypothetical protein [Ignavibacteriales bacterium]
MEAAPEPQQRRTRRHPRQFPEPDFHLHPPVPRRQGAGRGRSRRAGQGHAGRIESRSRRPGRTVRAVRGAQRRQGIDGPVPFGEQVFQRPERPGPRGSPIPASARPR